MRRICVVTGTRAEYGLLRPVMRRIARSGSLALQVIATGMHLSQEFGHTAQSILDDGFTIDERVEMLLSSDTPVGITKSMGLGVIGFADALARLAPDLVLVLGDRFEILSAVQAALIARIPVAHLCGGDSTEGAFDEGIRHAITKMAHLHFVSNAHAALRVRQMGENPAHIFNVGSPGIDTILELDMLSREALATSLGIHLAPRMLLVTYHPETLSSASATGQLHSLFGALDAFCASSGECSVVFTMPNADTGGREIMEHIRAYAEHRPHVSAHTSLGQLRYLSAMRHAAVVVGNSSSGLYEAPSLHVPTVNIGDRQKGRLRAASVIDCAPEKDAILAALNTAIATDCSAVSNPYGDGRTAERIVTVLESLTDTASLVRKHFFALDGDVQ